MNPIQKLVAQRRTHEILAEHYVRLAAPIPDCDGVLDCYFCAAGEQARSATTRRAVSGN